MDNQNIYTRLLSGETVFPGDKEGHLLREASYSTIGLIQKLNSSSNPLQIRAILSEIVGYTIDDSTAVFPPFYINYGKHTKIGKNVFINFGCTILDWGGVTIEDNVLIAPNVSLLSEGHPISPKNRHALVPKSIHIKENAWIGANATILQGVTIGKNAIVAAGAVVSSDVPDNSIVGGIPAKILKTINEDE